MGLDIFPKDGQKTNLTMACISLPSVWGDAPNVIRRLTFLLLSGIKLCVYGRKSFMNTDYYLFIPD